MPQLYWLICIAQHKLGRTTLKHIKSFLSAVFSYAKNQGVLNGVNPIQDAMIPKKAPAPPDTHAATLEEVLAIMEALEKAGEKKACVAVALMFLLGCGPVRHVVCAGGLRRQTDSCPSVRAAYLHYRAKN
jgi:integrase